MVNWLLPMPQVGYNFFNAECMHDVVACGRRTYQ